MFKNTEVLKTLSWSVTTGDRVHWSVRTAAADDATKVLAGERSRRRATLCQSEA